MEVMIAAKTKEAALVKIPATTLFTTEQEFTKRRRARTIVIADGVVRNVSDHAVCASKVASQLFLIAQPPLLWRRGITAFLRLRLIRRLLRQLQKSPRVSSQDKVEVFRGKIQLLDE